MLLTGSLGVRLRLIAVAFSLVISGCGDAIDRSFAPVRGQVRYNGQPLAGAELTLHPRFDDGPGWLPVAVSGDDGRFEFGTRLPNDGALPGRYAVTVLYRPSADEDDNSPNLLPETYSLPDRSGLELEVVADSASGADTDHLLELTGHPLREQSR